MPCMAHVNGGPFVVMVIGCGIVPTGPQNAASIPRCRRTTRQSTEVTLSEQQPTHHPHDITEAADTAGTDGSVRGGTPRRSALAGAGALAGTAAVLSACGSSSGSDQSSGKASIDPKKPVDLTSTADVPVGSGIKASADGVTAIVSQPKPGEFKAFSSSCTHQGCSVNVQKDTITCPCHSSVFSLSDGSVQAGPAPEALPEYTVAVNGDRVTIS